MRSESARVLVVHTVALRDIVAIDCTYGYVAFVGCINAEGTSRKPTLHIATAAIAWVIQAGVHLFIIYREPLTPYTE